MTSFEIDISKLNTCIEEYKNSKKDFLEDITSYYEGLKNINFAWNDMNTSSFVEKMKKDKFNIDNYFIYLDNIYKEMELFKSNIDDIIQKYGYQKNKLNVKFDEKLINEAKTYLNYVINLLNDSLYQINTSSFDSSFTYINSVYYLKSEINVMKNNVYSLLNSITTLVGSIKKEVESSEARKQKIEKNELKLECINHEWELVDVDLK